MDTKANLIDPLIERVEEYGKTSFKLLKLKSIDKTADVVSTLTSRTLFAAVLSFFILMLNVAIALWLGDLLGKTYYGFFAVASFYAAAGTVLFFLHPTLKARVKNSLVNQMLN